MLIWNIQFCLFYGRIFSAYSSHDFLLPRGEYFIFIKREKKIISRSKYKVRMIICLILNCCYRSANQGGVGENFFEGMMNLSYLKKLKKRLHETTEYFQSTGEKGIDDGKPITDERRIFYLSTAK